MKKKSSSSKKAEQSETTNTPFDPSYREGWLDCLESIHVAFFSKGGLCSKNDFVDMYDIGDLLEEKKQFVFKSD